MFFKSIKEISALAPTSKWNKLDKLQSLLEEEEMNRLIPILGQGLYDVLQESYDSVTAGFPDGIIPSNIADIIATGASRTLVNILRACQRVAFYMTLADNSGLLNVSFNEGGGVNSATADNYDDVSDKVFERFERDAFAKGNRAVDNLLLLLEHDAQSERQFTDMWMHSRYFYSQGNLLFTTATELQQFMDINESRAKFISLVPQIRYCQQVYIEPIIGSPLLQHILALKLGNATVPPGEPGVSVPSVTPGEFGVSGPTVPSVTPGDSGVSVPSVPPETSVTLSSLSLLISRCLSALAFFVSNYDKLSRIQKSNDRRESDTYNQARMMQASVREIIKSDPDSFLQFRSPEIDSLLPPADASALPSHSCEGSTSVAGDTSSSASAPASPSHSCEGSASRHHHHHHSHQYDPDDPSNAILFIGGLNIY